MIRWSITGWFILFCLLVGLAITSDTKAKPVYLGKQQSIVTGIEVEAE